jgi:hypothetical protein
MIAGPRDTMVRFGDLVFEDARRRHRDAFRDARRQVHRDAESRMQDRRSGRRV